MGRRNYRFFYMFIISLAFLAVFIFACAIAHLILSEYYSLPIFVKLIQMSHTFVSISYPGWKVFRGDQRVPGQCCGGHGVFPQRLECFRPGGFSHLPNHQQPNDQRRCEWCALLPNRSVCLVKRCPVTD